MNNTISELFSGLLGICHTVVIMAALYIIAISNADQMVMIYTIGAVVIYIFAVGLFCTLLAIREHLERLVELQTPKAKETPTPKTASPEPVATPDVLRVRKEGFVSKQKGI